MNKSYLEIFAAIDKGFHKELKSSQDKIFTLFDNIIVWIIGFSTGAIALIFSSTDKLNLSNTKTIKYTLIFLVASILLGVLGRIIYAVSSYLGYKLSSLFDFELNQILEVPYNPRILQGDESAEIIYEYMKEDFKLDWPFIIEQKKLVAPENLSKYDENIRNSYNEHAKRSINEIMFVTEKLQDIKKNVFGFKNIPSPINNRLYGIAWRYSTVASYCFCGFSLLSFAVSICIFTADYINSH